MSYELDIMCGILVYLRRLGKLSLKPLRRRGPDEQGTYYDTSIAMGHTRLSIVHPDAGPQPIRQNQWVLVVNGELYNANCEPGETDCYWLVRNLAAAGPRALLESDGVFSFVAYHVPTQRVIIGRDPIGVTPLYYSETCVSSLLTAIKHGEARVVPPGHVADFTLGETPVFTKWTPDYVPRPLTHPKFILVDLMTKAVSKRLMGDVPWGVLLSGGLDSTIVAALAVQAAAEYRPDYPKVHSFCIGLHDSPDVAVAQKAAVALGTHHTTIVYTKRQGRNALRDVIRAIETYDVTTIRASVPMWILGRAISKRGIKMVLSGEGSDELFAGYLYNRFCPDEDEMQQECRRKMDQLWAYDCLRANKTMGDWGVETRVPFLDNAVVDFAMNRLPASYKMSGTHKDGPKAEKWWLREQFQHIVPACVLHRTKAQFSDAVGSQWIQYLQQMAAQQVTDAQMAASKTRFPYQTPMTKEAYWYRSIFAECFAHVRGADNTVMYQPSIACSTGAAVKWHAGFQGHVDPSGDAIHAVERES